MTSLSGEEGTIEETAACWKANALEQADKSQEAGGPCSSLKANVHESDSQDFPFVPNPNEVRQKLPLAVV